MKKNGCRVRIFVLGSVLNTVLGFCPQGTLAQASHVTSYRVSGWQADLVQGSPNLKNFYWEPLTKRRILTTRRTSRQAESAPLPHRDIVYLKVPAVASKPAVPLSKPKSEASESSAHTSETSCVLSYKQSVSAEVGRAALMVNARLAQKNVDSKIIVKGLSASQSCLSLTPGK